MPMTSLPAAANLAEPELHGGAGERACVSAASGRRRRRRQRRRAAAQAPIPAGCAIGGRNPAAGPPCRGFGLGSSALGGSHRHVGAYLKRRASSPTLCLESCGQWDAVGQAGRRQARQARRPRVTGAHQRGARGPEARQRPPSLPQHRPSCTDLRGGLPACASRDRAAWGRQRGIGDATPRSPRRWALHTSSIVRTAFICAAQAHPHTAMLRQCLCRASWGGRAAGMQLSRCVEAFWQLPTPRGGPCGSGVGPSGGRRAAATQDSFDRHLLMAGGPIPCPAAGTCRHPARPVQRAAAAAPAWPQPCCLLGRRAAPEWRCASHRTTPQRCKVARLSQRQLHTTALSAEPDEATPCFAFGLGASCCERRHAQRRAWLLTLVLRTPLPACVQQAHQSQKSRIYGTGAGGEVWGAGWHARGFHRQAGTHFYPEPVR